VLVTQRFVRILAGLISVVAAPLAAQSGYSQPAPAIARILDAPAKPTILTSPDKTLLVLLARPGLPSIAEVSEPEYRLAGLRMNPRNSGPSRQNPSRGISVMPMTGGAAQPVAMQLPAGGGISYASWSPSGKLMSFVVSTDDALTLWVADPYARTARQISTRRLNAVLGAPCDWMTDAALVCTTIPDARGAEPAAPSVPNGPIVQEALSGRADRVATYQDLLKSPHDEALFEHYATSQLVRFAIDGSATMIGNAGMISAATPSPDGQWLLVTSLARPFSYQVPLNYFPTKIEVWTPQGSVARTLAARPLIERVPWGGDAAQTGPRSPSWREARSPTRARGTVHGHAAHAAGN
jgi:hypothetical protein